MIRRPLCVFCLFVIVLCFIYIKGEVPQKAGLPFEPGDTVVVTGIVVDKAIKSDKQVIYLKNISFKDCSNSNLLSSYQLENSHIQNSSDSNFLENNIGAICYLDSDVPLLGSFVMLKGRAEDFGVATNPGEFDMGNYYRISGYHFVIYDCEIVAKSNTYNIYTEHLYIFKQKIGYIYEQLMKEDDAQLIKAMVLGDKGNLDKSIKDLYQESGLAHLLAISGLHVSLIGMCVYKFLKKLKLCSFITIGTAVFVMINYGIMTGLGGSILRALIMFSLMLSAKLFRRVYDMETAIMLAAALIVISNPYMLFYSGFWMSFTAVTGIAIFGRAILIKDEVGNRRIRAMINTVLASVSVSFFTLPVILHSYYEYPVFSILINLMLVPFMSILLIAAILVGLIGLVNMSAAALPAYICHLILSLYRLVCEFFAELPFSHIVLGKPGVIKICIFYLGCIAFYCLVNHQKRKEDIRKKRLSYYRRMEKKCIRRFGKCSEKIIGINKKIDEYSKPVRQIRLYEKLIIMSLLLLIMIPNRNRTLVTMLDVGQGDGICIINGRDSYFIDGGSSSNKHLAEYVLEPYLKSEGIGKIEFWFVSHPDLDHISGLVDILSAENNMGISIDNICIPDSANIENDAKELIELAGEKGINIIRMKRGDRISLDDMEFLCISPEPGIVCEDANVYSLVLYLKYGSSGMLFTGDATKESENEFINYCISKGINLSDIDILKCGHHGSNTSTGEKMLEAISPRVALISSGRNNRYGHPHMEVINKLSENNIATFNTQEYGAITVELEEDEYRITGFLAH